MTTEYFSTQSEPGLWTVGFENPHGSFEPESDHDSPAAADQRASDLNGSQSRFVYLRTEPGLWTVGEYGGVIFYPESDHASESGAAERVMELNA